jgi:hypothetical protein
MEAVTKETSTGMSLRKFIRFVSTKMTAVITDISRTNLASASGMTEMFGAAEKLQSCITDNPGSKLSTVIRYFD